MPAASLTGIPASINPLKVRIIMICEALPDNPEDYFYSSGNSLYVKNTVSAFNNAGIEAANIGDIIARGVYLTVAVKGPRRGLSFSTKELEQHSAGLEKELDMFPNAGVILLMGDAAIKAVNLVSQRKYGKKAVPAGSTYKIRNNEHYLGKIRVFPSYLQTGKNFLIEKSKRAMVAEDIKKAFSLAGG
jgi:uracil-DNA glycosylase